MCLKHNREHLSRKNTLWVIKHMLGNLKELKYKVCSLCIIESNQKSKTERRQLPNTWKLINAILNNNESIKMSQGKSKNTLNWIKCSISLCVGFRKSCIEREVALDAYIRKEENLESIIKTFLQRTWKKQKQNKYKASRMKEIIKSRNQWNKNRRKNELRKNQEKK